MSIRMLPALCAGLILAACADGGSLSQPTAEPPPAMSSAAVMPSEVFIDTTVSNQVHFQTDSAILQPKAQQILEKQAAWLQAYPQHTVTIEGHADERGTREYNLALGERRAQAVTNYLIALGVEAKRIKTLSYGKERPICADANEMCWNQNRRGVTALSN